MIGKLLLTDTGGSPATCGALERRPGHGGGTQVRDGPARRDGAPSQAEDGVDGEGLAGRRPGRGGRSSRVHKERRRWRRRGSCRRLLVAQLQEVREGGVAE